MTATATKTSLADAYRILCEQIAKRGESATHKVETLVHERHDFYKLEDFHNSTTIEEDAKIEFYRECVRVILNLPATAAGAAPPAPVKPASAEPASAEDRQKLFGELCELIRKTGGEAHRKVAAHLRAVTGKTIGLAVWNNDRNISDADKTALYRECIAALKERDLSQLKGTVGAGDKRVDPVELAEASKAKAEPEDEASAPATEVTPRLQVEEKLPDDPLQAAVLLLQRVARTPGAADEKTIRRIADEQVMEHTCRLNIPDEAEIEQIIGKAMNNGSFPVDRVKQIFGELAAGLTHRVEFVTASGELKPLDGLMHPQVPQIAAWLRAGVPVWAWGAAGSGKTHMARQIAAMLEVEPHVISIDPTLTVAKLMGYRNVANGDFIAGFVYKPFKNGGLVAADEKDTGDPGVMACANALLSNTHYLFPNGETVERHKQFHWLALANTKGMGAVAGYTARNRLDAATLDRFAVIEIRYDTGLELALACGQGNPGLPWKPGQPANDETQCAYVQWVQKVREHVGNSVLISPRASINGCKALRCGIPLAEVADALVFKLVTDDTRKRIEDSCGKVEEA